MKFSLCFALPALLAFSLVARPGAAQPAALSGQEVLDSAALTYAGLEQYQGSCAIITDGASSTGEGIAPTQIVLSATCKFSFVRNRKLTVNGNNPFGGFFDATASPTGAIIEITPVSAAPIRLFNETGAQVWSGDKFLGGLAGVSGGSALTMCAALMSDGAVNPFRGKGTPSAPAVRDLGATPCYVVTQTDEENKTVSTFRIEKSSFLLRRLEREVGTFTSPPLTLEMKQKYPQLAEMPQITTLYNRTSMVFSNEVAR